MSMESEETWRFVVRLGQFALPRAERLLVTTSRALMRGMVGAEEYVARRMVRGRRRNLEFVQVPDGVFDDREDIRAFRRLCRDYGVSVRFMRDSAGALSIVYDSRDANALNAVLRSAVRAGIVTEREMRGPVIEESRQIQRDGADDAAVHDGREGRGGDGADGSPAADGASEKEEKKEEKKTVPIESVWGDAAAGEPQMQAGNGQERDPSSSRRSVGLPLNGDAQGGIDGARAAAVAAAAGLIGTVTAEEWAREDRTETRWVPDRGKPGSYYKKFDDLEGKPYCAWVYPDGGWEVHQPDGTVAADLGETLKGTCTDVESAMTAVENRVSVMRDPAVRMNVAATMRANSPTLTMDIATLRAELGKKESELRGAAGRKQAPDLLNKRTRAHSW